MEEITKTIPAYNPADVNTLDGLNNALQDKILMNMEKVLPGIVQSYDRNANRAIIQPAITGVASQGQKVTREPLINVPVFCMSGGGIVLSFPLKQGDTGWLIAADRNISIFKQNLEESAPNDYRKHTFQDSFFIPDKINDISVSGEDENAFVLQTLTNTTKISLEDNKIDISAGSGASAVNIDDSSINTETTTIEVTASTLNATIPTSTITSNIALTGTLTTDGLSDSTGASGVFTSGDGKIITVVNGIVKSISGT